MGMKGSPRLDAVAPTETVAPVANTTAGRYLFEAKAVRPCIVTNNSGQTVYVNVNTPVASSTDPSATVATFVIPTGTEKDISVEGTINVKTVRVWFPTGATVGSFKITGF